MIINSTHNLSRAIFKGNIENSEKPVATSQETQEDTVEIKTKVKPPKISTFRLLFGVLTDEQIDQVNKSQKLPKNAKFVRDGYGGYRVAANLMGLTVGTRKLPEGFEVRKNVIGFSCVLPKDSEGLMVKKKSNKDNDDDD